MDIHTALKNHNMRISHGDKWLMFNEHESKGAAMQYYDVYQKKYRQKKPRVIAYGKSLENALSCLAE